MDLASRMTEKVAEDPAALMHVIEQEKNFSILIWAAGAVNACLLKHGNLASYEAAFAEFKQPEGMKYLPETWLQNDMEYAPFPNDAVVIIARRIERINSLKSGTFDHHAMEAAAWLLSSLLELVRDNKRKDAELVAKLMLMDSQLIPKTPHGYDIKLNGFRGALVSTMTAKDSDTDDIITNRDVAFINGCHLLAHLVEDNREIAGVIQRSKVPELVCDKIFHKVALSPQELYKRRLPLRWEAFAAATTTFLQVYLEARGVTPPSTQRTAIIDAMHAVLEKSFHAKASKLPYSSMTVHLEHFGAFKVMKHILDSVPDEEKRVTAQDMISKKAFFFATEMLKIQGAHEEAVLLLCSFVHSLLSACPEAGKVEADKYGFPPVLDRMLLRYEKYPLGCADVLALGAKLRTMMAPTRARTA